ncbi:RadC family protein [Roseateles amylovorans]|uniref:DNA repair protein RadC n=1 Tax=Roseateles amylovorans TaxID=2978473 RepID=A0ABY6B7L5_9BURK|nr:DNA repair protein RadC [Roseateles amylovorans]UXH80946.1 DNA repair protein RadC [Roseateles amylovorans]
MSAFHGLPPDARPREKLIAHGASALADAELLAVLLRTGLPGRSVIAFAQQVLDQFGGLAGLLRADPKSLRQVHGLGPAKGAALSAVLEIARRALRQPLSQAPVFDAVDTVRDYLALQLGGLQNECFAVMFLDTRHRLISLETLSHGTLSHTIAYPREVVKRALALNAGAAILAHNHPSGHAEPSTQDIELTRTMTAALGLVEVRMLDHFIVGADRVVSMAELGCL